MGAYTNAAMPTMAGQGVSVLAVDPAPQVLEGEWHGNQTVVLEFDTVEAAPWAWYDSEGYGKAKPLRQAAAETNAVIVAGFDEPLRLG